MADSTFEELAPGTVLNHWILDEPIGGGAMGMVWKGTDRRDGSRVAIKLLAQQFQADPSFRSRFEREAHLATLLKSPYTVQTHAFGRDRGFHFIIMEFVEGDAVDKLLADGPIALDEALEIATDTARALEAAATQRIVHKDLKPSNIIVSRDGNAKLVDFGIAGQTMSKDTSGGFSGTVQYAAPEQQKGEGDHRADIYALGATLFHMLAGRPPYTGRTNREILAQHLHAQFPSALLALQPEPVVDLIRRCMQKDPDDRYQSASDLAGALERVRTRLLQAMATIPPAMPAPSPASEYDQQDDDSSSGTLVMPSRPATRPSADAPSDSTVVFSPGGRPGQSSPPAPRAPAAVAATIATAGTIASAPTVAPQAPRPATSSPAVASTSTGAVAPPLTPPPTAAAPARDEGGSGGKGKTLLFAIGGLVVLGVAAVGAVLALSGGGGDDPPPATGTATAATSTTASASASPSVTASASATASQAASATTAAPTATATAEPATATPTAAPPTPTRPAATATQAPPTPTRPPAQAGYTFGGFSGGTNCPAVITATVNFTGATGQTVSTNWTFNGGLAGFTNSPVPVTGDGSVSFTTIGNPPAGTYAFTASAGGAVVASGSTTITCNR